MYADAAFVLHQMNLFDTARFSNKSLTNESLNFSHGRTTFAPAIEITIYHHMRKEPENAL